MGGGGGATTLPPNHLPSPPPSFLFVRPRVNLGARFTSKMVMDMQNVNAAIKLLRLLYVTFAKLTKKPLFAFGVSPQGGRDCLTNMNFDKVI